MAKKVQLKDNLGNKAYPVTSSACVGMSDGSGSLDRYIQEFEKRGYLFAGIATPSTNPGAPNGNVFYFATQAGTYTNFSGIEITDGEVFILQWNKGTWSKKVTGFATSKKLTEVESKYKQKKLWKNREVSILGNHAIFYNYGEVGNMEGYWVTEAIDVSGIYSLRTSEQNLGVGFWKSTNLNSESFLGFFETIDKVPAEALIAVICGSGSGKASIIVETQSATTETLMESKVYLSQAPSKSPFGDMVSDSTFDSVAIYNPTAATQLIIEESVETRNLAGYMLYFTSDLSSATVAEKLYFTDIHRADGKIVIDTKGQSCILLVFTKAEPLGVDYRNIKYSFVGQMKGVDKTLSFAKDRALATDGTIINLTGFSITENIAVENVKQLTIMNASNFATMYVGFWNTEEQKGKSFIKYYTFTDALANRNGHIIFDVPSDAVSCNITYTSSEHEVIVRGDFFDKVTREVDVKVLIDYTISASSSDYGELFIYDHTHDSVVVNVKGVERILPSINLSNLLGYCLYNGEPSKDTIMVKELIQWQNGIKSLLIPMDCEYVIFVFKKGNNEFYNLSVLAEERKNYSGIYVYPFRSVIGKTEYLYKESLFTGLNPNCNYEVRSSVNSKKPNNYSGKALSYEVASISDNLVFKVFDENDEMCAIKQVSVTAKEMPAEKLASKSKLNVFFMGDSLLNFNSCIIGSEFVRMLNTSDGESTKGDAIVLAALNLCKGKIETFGEDVGEDGVRFQTIKNLTNLMTKKRTSAQPGWEQNPFYNYESAEADEIGADGFNKRVDFKWYFEKNMGAGQYPNLIYITMGPNDVEATYHWEYGFAETQARNIVTMCRKIKAACDEIAGGESGVVIKFLTHQTYPLNTMHNYNFPIERQRNLWKYMYDAYYKAFKAEGISDWVELVDCASRFDWRIGYTTQEVSYNPRYTKSNDNTFISETCHMNRIGAYNYADCLINDFIADERFD